MLNNTLRLFALIILFAVVIISDIPFKNIYKNPTIQLYLAIACLIILMFIDNITGFIIILGLLTLYFRIYGEEIKKKKALEKEATKREKELKEMDEKENKEDKEDKCTMDTPCNKKILKDLGVDNMKSYITDENLLAAQTNIVDIYNYDNEITIVDNSSIINKSSYSSQGLNTNKSHIRGYDINNVYLGSLEYEILS
jgi:flagellar biosynthesis component FlhA